MKTFYIVAIDGPAASGKSTVAQKVSEKLNAFYISTGNMYRAVTLFALENNFSLNSSDSEKNIIRLLSKLELRYILSPKTGKPELIMNGKPAGAATRSPEVVKNVSIIAAMEPVRSWMIGKQRSLLTLGNIVMEGRDIGTVIFPDSKHKFFLTASPEVRAERRLLQAGETPADSTVASVAKEIAERDERDSKRKIAPLKKADDAIFIDSSKMTVDEVVDFIVSKVNSGK